MGEHSDKHHHPLRAILQPTTQAQVSGYKFLLRRAEHGVVMGDIRMIHDPLGARKKALAFGAAAALVVGLGAGAMAVFSPQRDPGEVPIMVAESGALFVRSEDGLHPVTNLASARLVVGEAATPARVSDSVLASQRFAHEVGIGLAPSALAESAPEQPLVACHEVVSDELHVGAGIGYRPLAESEAFVARDDRGTEWLVTSLGRRRLPSASDELGAATRQVLGIDRSTPVVDTSRAWLNTVHALPDFVLPAAPWEIADVGDAAYLMRREGLIELTPTQRDILVQLGADSRRRTREQLEGYSDSDAQLQLLRREYELIDAPFIGAPEGHPVAVCSAGTQRGPGVRAAAVEGSIPVLGAHATHYRPAYEDEHRSGLAFGVDTAEGTHVISEAGRRHAVPSGRELAVLGIESTTAASWPVVSLLPQGEALSFEAARSPAHRPAQD
ncbi:ESX-1 secretion system protein eccB1 [Corynebacterium ciconiae DSM 44920]|uniref:type VII secretion protein EccB n=1 Tax=Corynebacterium ciconiae TaxID=227319 RepID=UPI00037E3F4C|nr:type VII secretion protein EccB [Corynebacterium ciconiae]WKD60411.1 ESX-1 secretion system protein eccB1 [Corynebacterium ciconiae DSM 44920]